MRYLTLLLLLLAGNTLRAQKIDSTKIFNSWVLQNVTFQDNAELPDDYMMKYAYMKYVFTKPDKLQHAAVYYEVGDSYLFEINKAELTLKSEAGYKINRYHIDTLTATRLVLSQTNYGDVTEASLKFHFAPEAVIQQNLKLGPANIADITGGDTVYKQSAKVYARFTEFNFQSYLYKNTGVSMDGKSGHFFASFVISKTGVPDSLHVIEGISPKFDKAAKKAFAKAADKWRPAMLNGTPVPVRMVVELRYSTSDETLPLFELSGGANRYLNARDYVSAIAYCNKIIEGQPYNKEALFIRGICNLMLQRYPAAKADWKRSKSYGDDRVDKLLAKFGE